MGEEPFRDTHTAHLERDGTHAGRGGADELGRAAADVDDKVRACRRVELGGGAEVGQAGFFLPFQNLRGRAEQLGHVPGKLVRVLGVTGGRGRRRPGKADRALVHRLFELAEHLQGPLHGGGGKTAGLIDSLPQSGYPHATLEGSPPGVDDEKAGRVGTEVDGGHRSAGAHGCRPLPEGSLGR